MEKFHDSFETNEAENCDGNSEEATSGNGTNCQKKHSRRSILCFTGSRRRLPLVNFSVSNVLLGTQQDDLDLIKQYHMTFKFVKTEAKIVRRVLGSHGFKEAHPYSNSFNLMWSGGHFRPYTLRGLTEFQKANHFPRSFELTRKDKLYRNIQRMQNGKGTRHFDFIPTFFVLPSERPDFHNAFLKDKGPWIVKPVASSRGRGIFLIKDANMVPTDEQILVCRYIENPLLVNGFKFDCRIYVAVTSFDPLTVYMYKEGLARFSTVKYERNFSNIRNLWMHLTNYSIQKNNENYVKCDDAEVDNFGSKWSFSALLRHLKSEGFDTKELMIRIEDLIVKTFLSVEFSIGTACRMFVPHKNSCFELYGFDVLIDENLKPWLLEVNLSPSLACESPLDLKIKANLISDLFNLIGFQARDPVVVKAEKGRNIPFSNRSFKQRNRTLSSSATDLRSTPSSADQRNNPNERLSTEELRMIREAKEEYHRRGKFVRVYPTPESWELYASLQEHSSTKNKTLHTGLFPELWRSSQRATSAKYMARARTFSSTSTGVQNNSEAPRSHVNGMLFQSRYQCYEKKLESWDHKFHDEPSSSAQNDNGEKAAKNVDISYENHLIDKTDDKADILKIIRNGDNLSKSQAREAFAVYLERVQARLVKEISASVQRHKLSADDELKQQEQMDLILRFLKKAAVNFKTPMPIITPSKRLLFQDRQRMLARQLRDFVAVYRKETIYLCESGMNDMTDLSHGNPFGSIIEDDDFQGFLAISSEQELEELLSVYTKSNKAAAIFLGEKSANRPIVDGPKDKVDDPIKTSKSTTWKDFLRDRDAEHDRPTSSQVSGLDPTAKIYGKSLANISRPMSANPKLKQGRSSVELVRPTSAFVSSNSKLYSDAKVRGIFTQRENGQDEKLNNRRTRNHVRHSSAPLHGRTSSNETRNHKTNTKDCNEATNTMKCDADKTFESFVGYENSFLKDQSSAVGNINEVHRTMGTQTLDMENGSRNKYFSQRESKRVNANVRRAQKAYYDAYLKQLCTDKTDVAPHPPSQPPTIKRPVNTIRMNRIMSKTKDKV